MFIILWDFLMVDHIFISLQVKRSVIISNKHAIHNLPNDLRLRILENIRKILKLDRVITSRLALSFLRNEHFVSTSENLLKNRN